MTQSKLPFNQSLHKFNEVVRELITSSSFSKDDLLTPLNAMRHLYRDELFAALESCGAIQFLTTATDSHKMITNKTERFRINDNGFVQITTRDEDDLQITTPSFREIIEQYVLHKDHEMYWAAIVYLYVTGEEQILAHIAKEKIEKGLI